MATKNTRNAAFLISATLGGTYTKITKQHGMTFNMPTDFSDDTGYGQRFKTAIPGLSDFAVDIMNWYDTAYTTLEYAAYNRVSYYFLAYVDYADVQNYYRGQCYFGLESLDVELGNTADFQFTTVLANEDIQIVRGGTAL